MSTVKNDQVTLQNGFDSHPQVARIPNWWWLLKWVALTTVAFLVAVLLTAPFAAILMVIFNLGVDAGITADYDPGILNFIGFFISFSLTLAAAQWLLLRDYLPNARGWFVGTVTGLWVGGLFTGFGALILTDFVVLRTWEMAVYLIPVGCALGLAQWLIIRHILPNAFWIVIIDIAAACSPLLAGRSITSIPELLLLLILPGGITGLGIWFLMRTSQPVEGHLHPGPSVAKQKRPSPAVWIGIGLVALVPLFFLFSWVYAASQLALAKNHGIYPTVEEAVIEKNSQGWGGAQVVKVEEVRASVNQHDGSQPHVWFGGARVYLDRAPQGWDRTTFSTGSYYLHVKEGWVLVPEGAFPEFIGWVMELYDMEGVNEWIAENR